MSVTELYKIPRNGCIRLIGEAPNSHRGAEMIWHYLYGKYMFPIDDQDMRPNYFDKECTTDAELRRRRIGYSWVRHCMCNDDKTIMNRFWNLARDPRLTLWERVLLRSTYDRAIVLKDNVPQLLNAYDQYVHTVEDPGNIPDQISIICQHQYDRDLIGICWNQTSVNADAWRVPSTRSSRYLLFNWQRDSPRNLHYEICDASYWHDTISVSA